MPAYLSQAEAATYVDSIGTWSSGQAVAYLTAASAMVDQYCQRSFSAADLTADVKLAVCFLADWLKSSDHVRGNVYQERIGDYSAMYQSGKDPLPPTVTMLLQPYRNIVLG